MSIPKDHVIIAFDLYGTLLSTDSIAAKLAEHYGEDNAAAVAATWRKYQLEYTWRLNSMQQYTSFSAVTRNSLLHTLKEHNLAPPSPDALTTLLNAYTSSLTTYPDVCPALSTLSSTSPQQSKITPVIFTNGTSSTVTAAVANSPNLSPYKNLFADIVSVEAAHRFKPAPEAYALLARRCGVADGGGKADMGRLWLVSGNAFDVVGARAVGMNAAWVNRAGSGERGWVDGLVEGEVGRPTGVVGGVGEVLDVVRRHGEEGGG